MISFSDSSEFIQIKAIQSFLFFLLRTQTIFADHDVYREQILTTTSALLTDAKDFPDRKLFPFVLIVDTGTFLDYGNGVELHVQISIFLRNWMSWLLDVRCHLAYGLTREFRP